MQRVIRKYWPAFHALNESSDTLLFQIYAVRLPKVARASYLSSVPFVLILKDNGNDYLTAVQQHRLRNIHVSKFRPETLKFDFEFI